MKGTAAAQSISLCSQVKIRRTHRSQEMRLSVGLTEEGRRSRRRRHRRRRGRDRRSRGLITRRSAAWGGQKKDSGKRATKRPEVLRRAVHELVVLPLLGFGQVPQEVLPRAPRHPPQVFALGAGARVLAGEPRQGQGILILGGLDLLKGVQGR